MGLKPPVNRATLKGIIVHDVLSRYFDLEKTARGLDGLHELFRTVLTESIAKRKKARHYGGSYRLPPLLNGAIVYLVANQFFVAGALQVFITNLVRKPFRGKREKGKGHTKDNLKIDSRGSAELTRN